MFFDGQFRITVERDPYDLPVTSVLHGPVNKGRLVFLTAHLLGPQTNTISAHCSETPNIVEVFVKNFTRNGTDKNVCVSATQGMPAWISLSNATPVLRQPISKTEGRVAMSHVCKKNMDLNPSNSSSNANFEAYNLNIGAGDMYYAWDSKAAAKQKWCAVDGLCMLACDTDLTILSTCVTLARIVFCGCDITAKYWTQELLGACVETQSNHLE